MRYENPHYMAEDAGAADLISGQRLQLGISRGSPEQVIEGYKYFGHHPKPGQTDAELARDHTATFLEILRGEGFAEPNPRPMFSNPPGLLRIEPHSDSLRQRIWWGAASDATAVWTAEQGMNLMSSTLKLDESGKSFHIQQAEQIRAYREEWAKHDRGFTPRVSVSRSIIPLTTDLDRAYFGVAGQRSDQIGNLDDKTRAIFGRSYTDKPDQLVAQLLEDEALKEADTVLLTVPNQLGVAYCVHILESFAKHVAPSLGWKPNTDGPVEGYAI